MEGKPLSVEHIAAAVPLCPKCQAALVARRPDRRFLENNRYAECLRGHVFELAPIEGPTKVWVAEAAVSDDPREPAGEILGVYSTEQKALGVAKAMYPDTGSTQSFELDGEPQPE